MDRRTFLCTAGWAATATAAWGDPKKIRPIDADKLRAAALAAEASSGGRLGVAVYDTGGGARFALHGDDRFPMCSTFKFLLVAAVLQRVDQGGEQLERRLPVAASNILSNSPFSQKRVGGTAGVVELCEAAMTVSDNAAANLLLARIDGPAGLTRFLRGLGDTHTRSDRIEPAMSESAPGDPRDTTTPLAMVRLLDRIVLGKTLSAASRQRILDWLVANRTGDNRLRAGLPKDWRVGDKTGSGDHGTTNDIAILWPPGRPPLLVASYLTGSKLESSGRDAVHAKLATAIAGAI